MGAGGESENRIGGQGVALAVERKRESWTEGLIVVFEGDVSAGEAVVRIARDINPRINGGTVGARGERLDIAVRTDGAGFGSNRNGDGTRVAGTEDAVAGIMRGHIVASAWEDVGGGTHGGRGEWERRDTRINGRRRDEGDVARRCAGSRSDSGDADGHVNWRAVDDAGNGRESQSGGAGLESRKKGTPTSDQICGVNRTQAGS